MAWSDGSIYGLTIYTLVEEQTRTVFEKAKNAKVLVCVVCVISSLSLFSMDNFPGLVSLPHNVFEL